MSRQPLPLGQWAEPGITLAARINAIKAEARMLPRDETTWSAAITVYIRAAVIGLPFGIALLCTGHSDAAMLVWLGFPMAASVVAHERNGGFR